MTTKPTRLQERARARLVDALLAIADAARLDDRANLGSAGLKDRQFNNFPRS